MIVVTSDEIPGRRIVETYGLVRGNAVRARHVGKDLLAFLRALTDPDSLDVRADVPLRVPSGLPIYD